MSQRANFSKALRDFVTLKYYFDFNSFRRVKRNHPVNNLTVLVIHNKQNYHTRKFISANSCPNGFILVSFESLTIVVFRKGCIADVQYLKKKTFLSSKTSEEMSLQANFRQALKLNTS